MSSTLDIYAISESRLQKVIGSRDKALCDAIIAENQYDFGQVDDIDDESELKAAEALSELIDGEISGNGGGYLYGYALRAICGHIGKELAGICPISGAGDWIEQIDRGLAAKALPLRLSDLAFGVCPVKIPPPDDYPSIGCWPAPQVSAALSPFRSANLDGLDGETTEVIGQIQQWLEAAAKIPDASIIGFLY